jgi:ankyrin repeat protein
LIRNCIKCDNPEIIESLIENGADLNIQDYRGETALMYALTKKTTSFTPMRFQCIKILLKYKDDILFSLKNKRGQTTFDVAQEVGLLRMFEEHGIYKKVSSVKNPSKDKKSIKKSSSVKK